MFAFKPKYKDLPSSKAGEQMFPHDISSLLTPITSKFKLAPRCLNSKHIGNLQCSPLTWYNRKPKLTKTSLFSKILGFLLSSFFSMLASLPCLDLEAALETREVDHDFHCLIRMVQSVS
jgi:hypothetical protein